MELKEQIYAAAFELFRTHGLHFTMQDVAQSIHISKKTIYTVFSSKEELLLGMVDLTFEHIHARKNEIIRSAAPLAQRVREVIVALPEELAGIDLRRLTEAQAAYPSVAQRVREHLETGWEPTRALLEEGVRAGELRPVPLPVLRQMLTASFVSFLSDPLPGITYRDTLTAMMDILMNGIRRNEYENQPV